MAAVVVLDQLRPFLLRQVQQPFAWGKSDCCTFAADWIRLRTGRDPAGRLRGLYGDETGARLIAKPSGGLAGLMCGLAVRAGLTRTRHPRIGDVGMVVHEDREPIMAIRVPVGWAARTLDGIYLGELRCLRAWRVA